MVFVVHKGEKNMRFYLIVKRLVDIVGSVFGLIILSPILIIVSIWIRQTMGTPVFFFQQRPGLHAQPFRMIKFRTMTNNCDENSNLLHDEKRITKFGNFLRRTSIDELPELINVLRGEMSLVGPRPLLMQYIPLYSPEQARRHNVKPGITGLAQIKGRNAISWEEKFEYDICYVDKQSIWLDIKIMFLTIFVVVCQNGINAKPDQTMPLFTGTLRK
jgi:lipopolysaccharide/colanic/teichoic acid biosynthesis glycosyltransferase